MKMTATIALEFESAGETTHNAMDAALIRGLEALKKRHRTRSERQGPERHQVGVYKMGHCNESCFLERWTQ
jgi:hypothetical protein